MRVPALSDPLGYRGMFADFLGHLKGLEAGHPDTRVGGKYFRWYLVWLTFPPMLLLLFDQPFLLVVIYGVLGALFMPFMAIANLGLLNGRRIPHEWRNSLVQNLALGVTAVLFATLGAYQIWQALT